MNMKKLGIAILIVILIACFPAASFAASVSVSATPDTLAGEGEVTFAITIKNDGEHAMEAIQIISAYSGINFSTEGVTIQKGATQSFTKTVILSDAMIGREILFDIQWKENGQTMRDSKSIVVRRAAAANVISVNRTASARQAAPGETITLLYTVRNLSPQPMTNVSITDSEIGGKNAMVSGITVEAGGTYEFEYTYKMGKSTVISAPVVRYTMDAQNKTFSDVPPMTLGMINAKLTVEVEQGAATEDGVPFTIYLTNNGNQKINAIKIVDELGNRITESTFSLAVGESKSIPCTISNKTERYVVFTITGVDASGEEFFDKTESKTVRRYIDPASLGMEFGVEVLEPLNANGTIKVQFKINNTGSVNYSSLTISEAEAGELYRQEELSPGVHPIEQTVYVGAPRDLVFTLDVVDPVGNPYSYTAHITANHIAVEGMPDMTPGADFAQQIESLGMKVGSTVSNTLMVILIVLFILTAIAAAALIALSALEKKHKAIAAQKRYESDIPKQPRPYPPANNGETRHHSRRYPL